MFAITSPTHNQSTRTTTHGCKILSRCRSAPAVSVRRCDGGSSFSPEEDICATHRGNRQSDPLFHGCSYIFHMSGNNEQLEMTHHCRNSAAVGPPDADTRRRWRRNCTGGRQRVRADRRNRSHLVWGAVRAEMSPIASKSKNDFSFFFILIIPLKRMKGYARELFMVWWRVLGGAAALGLGSCPLRPPQAPGFRGHSDPVFLRF